MLVVIPLLLLLSFFIIFIILYQLAESPKNNISILVNSMAVTGFFAVFGQIGVAIAQEYNKYKSYNIQFIAKGKSPFSTAILTAIQAYFANSSEFKLTWKMIDSKTSRVEEGIISAIEEAIGSGTHGLIIRPTEVSEKLTNTIVKALTDGIFIVLVDIDLGAECFPKKVRQLPFFVGSDLSEGGKLVSDHINKFLEVDFGASFVYLLLGPDSASAIQRGKSIAWHICRQNNQKYTQAIWLSNWNKDEALDTLIESIKDDTNFTDINKSRIFIYCANDNIACFILEQILNSDRVEIHPNHGDFFDVLASKKDIQIMGYDGLIDDEEDFKIKRFARPPITTVSTVNVNPNQIGSLAADATYRKFKGLLPAQKRQDLIPPELIFLDKKCP
jgi:ABC-type sugar transport system substrate-binding protein